MSEQKNSKSHSIHTDDPFDIIAIRAKMIFNANVTGLMPITIYYKGKVILKED